MNFMNLILSNSQVVERERNDSKAEQEKLNTQIQEFLKELEVTIIKLLFFVHLKTSQCHLQKNGERGKKRHQR